MLFKTPVNSFKKGFITHEDQEINGLAFSVLFFGKSDLYLLCSGDTTEVEKWRMREGASEVTKTELQQTIQSDVDISSPCEYGIVHDISTIKAKIISEALAKVP